MVEPLERRRIWSRIIGVERRAAPLPELDGRPLPDPTRLEDEEFLEAQARPAKEKPKGQDPVGPWEDPTRFD